MNLTLKRYSTRPILPSFDQETPLPQAVPPGFTRRVMVRATDIRKTTHGVIELNLHNIQGTSRATIRRPGIEISDIKPLQPLEVDVAARQTREGWMVEAMRTEHPAYAGSDGIVLLPRFMCAEPESLDQMRLLVQGFASAELRAFVNRAFLDLAIAIPFLEREGGVSPFDLPGGLLRRAVAMATFALSMSYAEPVERQVVAAAALLMELGRVRDVDLAWVDRMRRLVGFMPHPETMAVLGEAFRFQFPYAAPLRELLRTGYCEQFEGTRAGLRGDSALAWVDEWARSLA